MIYNTFQFGLQNGLGGFADLTIPSFGNIGAAVNLPTFNGTPLLAPTTSQGDRNQLPTAQTIQDTQGASPCNPFTGQDCTVSPLGQSLDNWLNTNLLPTFKNVGLLLLALVLLGFGLYSLVNSTSAGKAVISSAKLAAV